MALDPTLSAELDKDWAAGVSSRRTGNDHAMERLRSNFDQDGRALGAAIGATMLQASLPSQDSGLNAAMRTPGDIGQTGSIIPSGSVVGGGAAASK